MRDRTPDGVGSELGSVTLKINTNTRVCVGQRFVCKFPRMGSQNSFQEIDLQLCNSV
jgi:hypothetical protein